MVVHPSDKNASINSHSQAIEDMVGSMPANLNRSNKYVAKDYVSGKLGLGLNVMAVPVLMVVLAKELHLSTYVF